MSKRVAWLVAVGVLLGSWRAQGADETIRPLRYQPVGTDFSITNGTEFFNRPLYCCHSAFRIDAGDKPEFSVYLPGRGGNLRFGLKTAAGEKWLFHAAQITALYRPGSMIYHVRDPSLGQGEIELTVLPFAAAQGFVTKVVLHSSAPVELIWAYGGVNGEKGQRNGDIGCEKEPVSRFFQLKPEYCAGDAFRILDNIFTLSSKPATLAGIAPPGAKMAVSDAAKWDDPVALLAAAGQGSRAPVIVGEVPMVPEAPLYFALQRLGAGPGDGLAADKEAAPDADKAPTAPALAPRYKAEDLPKVFEDAERQRRAVAEKVVVDTPDAFINAAVPALLVAGDGVWDEKQGAYMHGAVAWRVKLLGWRGPYLADDLGWHERAGRQFTGWAGKQNTDPIAPGPIIQDAAVNLARDEPALHSNGDLSHSHYDMNLVYIDEVMRHLLWTGDLAFARQLWPVIVRHLAWEQRLFRRPFGPDRLPLYEAYCCIWASDDLQYGGGGATHATAYNYYHNKMAARLARMLGEDAAPFEQESQRILQAMRRELWLPDRGWYGEWKDLLGQQLVHPNAALWTFYHTVDSEAATPFEAWQMTRFIDTQIPHIPLHGPGVPEGGYCTLPTTTWMPYTWSTNNVVMAEVAHTSLGYWQAGRGDEAFRLFKGCLLDSMYLGLCPGNAGMCTSFDAYRHESQRDFADSVGTSSRAMVEGLFGVHPDALAGKLLIQPGFPAAWTHADMKHPDFHLAFQRDGATESYVVESHFPKPMEVRLQAVASRDRLAGVTVNGRPAQWKPVPDAIGSPRVEVTCEAAARLEIVLTWKGEPLARADGPPRVASQTNFGATVGPATLLEVNDPQKSLGELKTESNAFHGFAVGTPGHRTVFARVRQGDMDWWLPVTFEITVADPPSAGLATDWTKPVSSPASQWDTVNLDPVFNDKVTQIFQRDYRSPRSPYCSLAMPTGGIGTWIHWNAAFDVDDSGLRAVSDRGGGRFVVQGVPFQTPGVKGDKNIAFTSQWDNDPREVTVPLSGKASHGYFLMAGSTNAMQSRFENGDITVTYRNGSTDRLALINPTTWWPIDQDYYLDDYAFHRPEPIPPRVDLKTGTVRILDPMALKGKPARAIPGGAGLVLDLPLRPDEELQSLTIHARANEVVIGLMAVTLARAANGSASGW